MYIFIYISITLFCLYYRLMQIERYVVRFKSNSDYTTKIATLYVISRNNKRLLLISINKHFNLVKEAILNFPFVSIYPIHHLYIST
jgi:hypothetical protein